jgi:hypothetical protein
MFAFRNFLDKYKKILSNHNAIKFYWENYFLSKIDRIDPGIFIVSYPKSGRTWLRVLLNEYMQELFGELKTYNDKSVIGIPKGELLKFEHDMGSWVPAPPAISKMKFNKNKYRNKKIVFLIRDPRDVIVSSWHHLKYRENIYKGSISNFIRDDIVGINKIIKFMNMWIDNKDIFESFYLVSYEELHKETKRYFENILNFVGLPLDQDVLQRSIQQGQFENMKKMEIRMTSREPWMIPGSMNNERSMKIRKGKVGDYKNFIPRTDIKLINHLMKRDLNKAFSYNEA